MQRTITIYGRTVKSQTGNTFVVYSYRGKNDRFFSVRFTKNVRVAPPTGYVKITFNLEDVSLSRASSDMFNDILWIDNIIHCEEDAEAIAKAKQRRVDALNEII